MMVVAVMMMANASARLARVLFLVRVLVEFEIELFRAFALARAIVYNGYANFWVIANTIVSWPLCSQLHYLPALGSQLYCPPIPWLPALYILYSPH